MRVWSLFTGIGGFDLGFERAGMRVTLQCEADERLRGFLHERWPDAESVDDVRSVYAVPDVAEGRVGGGGVRGTVGGGRAPRADGEQGTANRPDVICGGFPCQDLSVAGRRAGLAGARSGLFFEFARIVDVVRPRWVVIENVPGLLSSDGGRDFGIVLGTLVDVGYGVGWRVLDSQFFGVPQRRRRVFIVANRADGDPRTAVDRAGAVLAVGARCGGDHPEGGKAGADVARASLSGLGDGGPDDNDAQAGRLVIAPALVSRYGADGHDASEDGTGRGTPLTTNGSSVRRLTPRECERLQGFPDDWTASLGADSRRYHALGNAVTVPVAEWIGQRLMAAIA